MREYPKQKRNDTTKSLSHWDKGGRDTRTGYGKKPNADMQPMVSKGSRTYPKGKSEFRFAKKSQPYERVMKLAEGGGTSDWGGGYADPADMAGPEYAASSSPSYNVETATASSYAEQPSGGGMRDSNIADTTGTYGGNAGGGWGGGDYGNGGGGGSYGSNAFTEPGFSGNSGAILAEATAAAQPAPVANPAAAILDAPAPTTDAYGRSYGNQAYTAPASVVGPPVSLDNPLPSYSYAQGKFGYALTTPNVPRDQSVLDGLVDIAIEKGLNPEDFTRIGFRESRFNPNAKNGQYVGMYQMSNAKAKEHGIDRRDWRQNATAAADDLADWSKGFQEKYGRAPTRGEQYLSHQQGERGISRLVENPDKNAVQARGSRAAILGNVDSRDKRDAANWTSQEFIDYWNGNLK